MSDHRLPHRLLHGRANPVPAVNAFNLSEAVRTAPAPRRGRAPCPQITLNRAVL